jgi:hypothetical protein
MTVKEEEAVVQAFIKMWKDLTKTGDKLNASQMDAAQKMMKHATDMVSNTKTQKTSLTITNKQIKFGEKELEVREKLKTADEHLVQLRHKLNIEQEREHGDQVRRNINLRHNMDSFNDKFDMLKKSLGGGFGFQAAIDKTVKNMGGMTRTFQENKIAGEKYKKSQDDTKEAMKKMAIAFHVGDKAQIQEARSELDLTKKAELRNKMNVENTEKDADKAGVSGRLKPIFSRLDKIGGFLGKKAVPIGIGMGVAGVLISIIVKAFSASPLFAQMMKMMKFMVTLILMPIGTFFGALLRPILIMLLRKFIVPFYSTWMPILMKVGGQVGNFISKLSWENIYKTLRAAITGSGLPTYDPITGEEEPINKVNPTTPDNDFGSISNPDYDPLDPNSGSNSPDKFQPKDGSDYDTSGNGNIHIPKYIPDGNGGMRLNPEWTPSENNPNMSEDGLASTQGINMTPVSGGEGGGTPYEEPDWEAIEREAGMYSVEQEEKDRAAAAAEAAEKAAAEELKRLEDLNRSVLEMNELMKTNGIVIEPEEKVMTQQMTDFAAYGMDKPERGGDIHDAGISMTQEEIDERNAGYQGYGGVSSTVLEGSGGRSSQSVMDNYNAYLAGVVPAANGFNGMVNSPTMFLAGEAGSEHVSITPSGESGGSGGITVNIQNMNGSDNDLRKLKQTILEVIQESSANRGRI